jgi:hypothetical protein
MEQNKEIQPYKGKGTITKSEICGMYSFSRATLHKLFNRRYFERLKAEGYSKNSKIISNRVFKKFTEIYGEPM